MRDGLHFGLHSPPAEPITIVARAAVSAERQPGRPRPGSTQRHDSSNQRWPPPARAAREIETSNEQLNAWLTGRSPTST